MMELLSRRCPNCETPVSLFSLRCPGCGVRNLPNPRAIITGLVAVLFVVGLLVLGTWALRGGKEPQAPAQADSGMPASQQPAEASDDFGWIMTAMAECDEEAKRKTDTLHFLVVPVTISGPPVPGWSPVPISTVGKSAVLLTWTDTLIGLRNRVLSLYRKPLGFSVTDPATGTVYSWKASTGVTALKARATDTDSLKLGLLIEDVSAETAWGPTIEHKKGSCHWINALVLPPRSRGPR